MKITKLGNNLETEEIIQITGTEIAILGSNLELKKLIQMEED